MGFRKPVWTANMPVPILLRRIGRLGENVSELMDTKLNAVYDQAAAVVNHGLQRGWVAVSWSGAPPLSASATITFDITTDGVRFSSAPLVWASTGGDSFGGSANGYGYSWSWSCNHAVSVTAVTTAGATIVVRREDDGALQGTSPLYVRWVARGPVAGI